MLAGRSAARLAASNAAANNSSLDNATRRAGDAVGAMTRW